MDEIRKDLEVITPDEQRIGRVAGNRDECVLVETGRLFKKTHAIPRSFLHPDGEAVKATVSKEIVEASPAVTDESWSRDEILAHYGLAGPYAVDPDPDSLDNAETEGRRAGVEPAPHERTGTLREAENPAYTGPVVRERQGNANDPTGSTANLK